MSTGVLLKIPDDVLAILDAERGYIPRATYIKNLLCIYTDAITGKIPEEPEEPITV